MRTSPKFACSSLDTFLPRTSAISGSVKSDSGLEVDEGLAHALGQFLDAPFRGEARGDDRAHRGAAEIIERHIRLLQRLDHADMGEAARAAARQHQTHRAAGDEAGEAVNVAGDPGAQMMMGFEQPAAQREMFGQAAGRARRDAAAEVRERRWRAP